MNNSPSSSSSSSSDDSVVEDNVPVEAPPVQAVKLPKILDLPASHDEALEFLFSKDILTRPDDISCPSCGRIGMRLKTKDKKIVSCQSCLFLLLKFVLT